MLNHGHLINHINPELNSGIVQTNKQKKNRRGVQSPTVHLKKNEKMSLIDKCFCFQIDAVICVKINSDYFGVVAVNGFVAVEVVFPIV